MKRENKYSKWKWYIILYSIVWLMMGCARKEAGLQNVEEYTKAEEEHIEDVCLELYEKAARENRMTDLEMIRCIVNEFGENGYTAVDSKNQIDMVNAEYAAGFCETAKAREEADISIIEVNYLGGFVKYDLRARNGRLDVVRNYYRYENGAIQQTATTSYQAEYWEYTEEGYLMFSGNWFSEELYTLTLSSAEDYTALRIAPLDEAYRELNRKYLLPISYEKNNMFLTDWNEDDFGKLNFYDVFDIFYPIVYGKKMPYTADENQGAGAVYQIPKEEFEKPVMAYFNIDSETLQAKTVYHSKNSAYEYKPRGFYEVEYFKYPYPEVVGFTENSDGTLTLTVNVVFPYKGISKMYAHEVVIRPLEDGGVQYVSNRIIPSEENYEATWHTPRLTQEEWEKMYGSQEIDTEVEFWYAVQADECLITEEEQAKLCEEALAAAEAVSEWYKDAVIEAAPDYASGISGFSEEQRKTVVEELGKKGLISVSADMNMQNYGRLEAFYEDYRSGQDSMVTVYEVHRDGLIGAITFICRRNELQTYYAGVSWQSDGVPDIQGTSVRNVAEIHLTEKGYFIYAYETVTEHASLRQYWRVKPLSDECRDLTEKYISGLSYVNYNMLVTNWNSSNVEDILMPCMFEDIYRISTGEKLKTSNWKIPAEQYENIMTTYFPVSVEQLRKNCGYSEDDNSYPHEMIYSSPYPPFGEVVDYMENEDGTITLMVDGVWPDYNSDYAFTNEIVVLPLEDGAFRYLSNVIEQKEMEIPRIAGTKAEEADKGGKPPMWSCRIRRF